MGIISHFFESGSGDPDAAALEGTTMNGKISWSRPEDVERLDLKADGVEFSHRLITKDVHGSSFSFHITHIEPYFEHVAKGDGEHESVLYCLHGGSTQTLEDGTVHEFRPGDAMYLPAAHEYKHKIGSSGLVFAVVCTPSR